jgi:hypothetical protein
MGTGYMGADEPAVLPKGSPDMSPPSEQTLTNLNVGTVEPKETGEKPAGEASAAPEAGAENQGQAAPSGEPAAKAEIKEPEPRVIEREVEKIVYKEPEFKSQKDKDLYDAWVEGRMDEVKNYWKEIDKDFDTMSHLDVIREGLAKNNPQWSKQDIEDEIKGEYGKELIKFNLADFDKENDPEGYEKAEAHNELADANALKIARHARDFRITLKKAQDELKAIELPKIKTDVPPAAEAPTAPTQEQLDEAARTWAEAAEAQVKDFADFKFQVGDEKNPEDVDFTLTPDEKKAIVEKMKTWNGGDFMSRRGWRNADGTFNLLKIAEDEQILIDNAKMVKSAYAQGVTNGRKQEVAKIKNVDLENNRQNDVVAQPEDAGDKVWG